MADESSRLLGLSSSGIAEATRLVRSHAHETLLPGEAGSRVSTLQQLKLCLSVASRQRPENNVVQPSVDLAVKAFEGCNGEISGLWQSSDDHDASVVALLLDMPSTHAIARSLLLHPLMNHIIKSSWYGTATVHPPEDWLNETCRPWLHHLCSLASYSAFLALTVSLALSPLAPPAIPTVRSIAWLVLGFAHVLQMLHHAAALELLIWLPTASALVLHVVSSPDAAYSLVCISLITLFVRLVLPTYPSLAFLLPVAPSTALPLSVVLNAALVKALHVFALLAPVVLILFAILSYALNGDIFRGFSVLNNPFPRESGVAPFEARAALAVTILVLILMGLLLLTTSASWRQGDSDDPWVRDFGASVACGSRRLALQAMNNTGSVCIDASEQDPWTDDTLPGNGSVPRRDVRVRPAREAPRLIAPFNLAGYLLADLPAWVIGLLSRNSPLSQRYRQRVKRWLWTVSAGWLCAIVVCTIRVYRRLRSLSESSGSLPSREHA